MAPALGDIANKVFLFDIDGVLNEAQQPISPEMHTQLVRLARHNPVYFVTGNTYTKSIDIINGHVKDFSGIFCNNADELRSMRGKIIWQDKETQPIPSRVETTLQYLLSLDTDCESYGNRIEWRNPRMINFSKIGRYAPMEVRLEHDASWRQNAMGLINCIYPGVETACGGSISIDIYSRGADKSRAAKWITEQGKDFIFIGDKTEIGGNDYCVKEFIIKHPLNICLTSRGPDHTMEMIDGFLG